MSASRARLPKLFLPLFLVLFVSAPSADLAPTVVGDLVFSALDGSSEDLDGTSDGIWTVPHGMILEGKLVCEAPRARAKCAMALRVEGDLVLQAGGGIAADEGLRIEVAGNLRLAPGTFVVSESGAVELSASGRIEIDGLVSGNGAGGVSPGGQRRNAASVALRSTGGPGRGIRVGASGTVLSTGGSGAGNRVEMSGCGLEVRGLVASIGEAPGAGIAMRSCEELVVDGRDLGNPDGLRRGRLEIQGSAAAHIDLFAQDSVVLDGAEVRVGSESQRARASGPSGHRIAVTSDRGSLNWRRGVGAADSFGSIRLTACDGVDLDGSRIAPEPDVVEACAGVSKSDPSPGLVALPPSFSGSGPLSETPEPQSSSGTCTPNLAVDNMTISTFAEFISCNVLTSSNTRIIPRGRVTYRARESIALGNGFSVEGSAQFTAIIDPTINQPPVITSDGGGATAAKSAVENTTAVTDVESTDPEGDIEGAGLTYSLTGGADQGKFSIVAATGVLTFTMAPDFDIPGDANTDNAYEVTVTVTDSGGFTDSQAITVTVTDVNEAPVITSDGGGATAAVNAAENQTAVTTTTATDPDVQAQTLTFSITGGADQALFGIVGATGVLTFNAAPNFETPADAGMNNVYDVQVTVTDNGAPNLSDVQDIAVTVTDVNEAPVITSDGGGATAAVNAAEDQTAVTTVTATDADLPAQTLTFSITGGADQALFGIVGATGVLTFNAAPNFEMPADAGMNNVYDVQVTVTDNGAPNLTDVQDVAVTVTDINDAPVITSDGGGATAMVNAAENQTAVTTVTATDVDMPAQTLTFSLTGGADQALFGIVPATGVLTFNAAPNFEMPGDVGMDNVYDVQVTATDNGAPNLTDVQDIAVTVTDVNEAPVITSYGGLPNGMDTIPENATNIENIESTDPDGTLEGAGGLTYSVTGGVDQALFSIQSTTGILVFNNGPDFEMPMDDGMNNIYDVQVTVTDPGLLTDVVDIAVTVTDVNDAPVITSDGGGAAAAVNAAENQTAVTIVTATDADLPAQTLTFSITGGADQAFFSVVGSSGVLTFNVAPDFENPLDAGWNNVYDVQVTVTDDGAPMLTDVQDIAVTVTNVNEAPVLGAGRLKFIEVEVDLMGGVTGLGGAAEVAVSPDGKHVYTASRGGGGAQPSVVAFSRSALTGEVTFVDAEVGGFGGIPGLLLPAAIEVSSDGRHVYVVAGNADFVLATAVVFSRDAMTGMLTLVESFEIGFDQAFGTGLSLSPDGRHVYISQAFPSKIWTYARNSTTGMLTLASSVEDNMGGVDGIGVVQAVRVSPDGRHVYGTGPDDDAVAVFSRDVSTGALTFLGLEENGVDGVDGLDFAIDLALSRDGLHLYAADVITSAVAVFSRNSTTGDLTFVEVVRQGVGGVDGLTDVNAIWVSEDGEHLYATNSTNNELVAFGRNVATGALTFLGLETDGADGVDGLDGATDVTVSPDARHVYVAGLDDDALAVFSRQDHSLQYPMVGGAIPIFDTGLDLTVTDIDSPTLVSAAVTITPNGPIPDPGMEFLAATPFGAIMMADIVYIEPTLTITPAAPAPLADFEAVLRSVTYENTAGTPANTIRNVTAVVNDGALDSNVFTTMLMFNTAPMAVDDAYQTLGNTLLEVDLAAPSGAPAVVGEDPTPALYADVLDNDTDAETPAGLTAAVVPATITAGAVVVMNADGSFSYTPPVGFTGMDTFDYEVSDPGGLMDTGTVEVTVSSLIWFVDKDNAGTADGRSATPYTSLAPIDAGGGDDALDGNGDTIFVFDETTGNTSGGILLETNQILHGNGIALDPAGFNYAAGTLVPAGTRPTIEDLAADVIELASGNTVRGLDIAATAGRAVFGNNTAGATFDQVTTTGTGAGSGFRFDNATGTIDVDDVDVNSSIGPGIDIQGGSATFTFDASSSITNPDGAAFNVNGGTATVTYPGSITQTKAFPAVSITNHSTGTIGFGGTISATGATTGTGLQFSNADGIYNVTSMSGSTTLNGGDAGIDILAGSTGTFTFGSIAITNPTGIGVNIDTSTGGTVDYNGTISQSNAASAVRVNGKTGGSATFSGLVTASTSTANGIDLTGNTGGSFTFSGGLNIDTTTGTGFRATGGGTVNVAATAGDESILTTAGKALELNGIAAGITFDSVSSTNSTPSQGIDIASTSGTVTMNGGAINHTGTGTAFDVGDGGAMSGSNANILYAGTIANNNGRGVLIQQRTGGTVTLSGTLNLTGTGIRLANNINGSPAMVFSGASSVVNTGTGDGVRLDNNDNATITFSGGNLDIDTTSGIGFNATGGAVGINVTGAGNTIASTTGTALNVASSTIGASGLTFESISAGTGAGSAGTGIGLDSTGTMGGLTVTGTGTAGSGGTIQNKTGANGAASGVGIFLSSTQSVSLTRMQLNDFDNFAIRGTSVTGFTLADSVINGTNGNSTAFDEGSVSFTNLLGSAAITNSNISGGHEDNVVIVNNTGTLDRLTVSGGTIGLNATATGNDSITIESQSSATAKMSVLGTSFTGARGDMVQCNAIGASTMDCVIKDNTFANVHTNIVPGGGGITISGGGAGSTSIMTYEVSGTNPGDQTFTGAKGFAITANFVSGAGTATGTIKNNYIGTPGVAGSGSTEGGGILAGASGTVSHTVTIDGNRVRRIGLGGGTASGIDIVANMDDPGGTRPQMNATVTNNNVAELEGSGGFAGLNLTVAGNGTENGILCADVKSNVFDASGGTFAGNAIFMSQFNAASNYNLPGYGGSANGETAFACAAGTASANLGTFLAGTNANTLTNGPFPFPAGTGVSAITVCGVSGTGTTCP